MMPGVGAKAGVWLAALLLAGIVAQPAAAASHQPSYLGAWLIAEARPAPWVVSGDPATQPHDAQLVGKTIVYERRRIVAPSPLACDKPNYAIRNPPPEGLFQGGLTAPAAQAAALGFRGRTIRTLETGCEGWFEFHFIDARTAMFALDNMVYTIRRQ